MVHYRKRGGDIARVCTRRLVECCAMARVCTRRLVWPTCVAARHVKSGPFKLRPLCGQEDAISLPLSLIFLSTEAKKARKKEKKNTESNLSKRHVRKYVQTSLKSTTKSSHMYEQRVTSQHVPQHTLRRLLQWGCTSGY